MKMINEDLFKTFLDLALSEDLRDGDHTSLSCIPAESEGMAKLLVKDVGIIAGIQAASMINED